VLLLSWLQGRLLVQYTLILWYLAKNKKNASFNPPLIITQNMRFLCSHRPKRRSMFIQQAQVRMLQVQTRTRRALAIRRADELAELRAEAERVRRLEFRTVGAARVLQRLWRTATLWETARTFVDLSVRRRREKMRNWYSNMIL